MDNTELENANIQETAEETPQAEAPAPRKKSKLPLIIVIVILILGAGGYFVYDNLPSTKAGKLIKQAEAFTESKEYDKAIDMLIQARETDPANQAVADTFFAVFDANAQDLLSASTPDYAKALDVYVKAESLMPDDKDAILQKEAEIYKLWAKADASSDDMELIKMQISKLAAAIDRGIPGLGVTKSELEKQLSQLESDKVLSDFAQTFNEAVQASDINLMIDLFTQNIRDTESELFKKTISKRGTRASSFPILAETGTENKLGIYYKNSEYFIYYGGYDADGKRSGDGIWVTTRGNIDYGTYRTYYYNGNWENDKPNGSMDLYLYTRFAAGNEETKISTANVKDGLFDGTFTYSYIAIGDFEVIYENGDPVQIDTRIDSDGSEIKVFGYNYDHSKMLINLQMHDGVFGTY